MTNNEIAKKILQITRTGYYEDQLEKIVKLLEASKPVSGALDFFEQKMIDLRKQQNEYETIRQKLKSEYQIKRVLSAIKLIKELSSTDR